MMLRDEVVGTRSANLAFEAYVLPKKCDENANGGLVPADQGPAVRENLAKKDYRWRWKCVL